MNFDLETLIILYFVVVILGLVIKIYVIKKKKKVRKSWKSEKRENNGIE